MPRGVAPAKDRRGLPPLGQTYLRPAVTRQRAPPRSRRLALPGTRLLPYDHLAAHCLATYGLLQLLLHLMFHALRTVLRLRS